MSLGGFFAFILVVFKKLLAAIGGGRFFTVTV